MPDTPLPVASSAVSLLTSDARHHLIALSARLTGKYWEICQ
jgi:hypothetical protein